MITGQMALRTTAVGRILRKGFKEFRFLEWHETPPSEGLKEFRDEFSSLEFLREFLHDRFSMMALRDILSEDYFYADLSRIDDQMVLREIANRLATDRLKIAPFTIPHFSLQPPAEEELEEEEPAPPIAAVAPEAALWIKFRIVEDGTDEPVPDVKLKIRMPTGEVREFTTDAQGMIEINDLPPGTCDIEEMIDDKALEVVQVS